MEELSLTPRSQRFRRNRLNFSIGHVENGQRRKNTLKTFENVAFNDLSYYVCNECLLLNLYSVWSDVRFPVGAEIFHTL